MPTRQNKILFILLILMCCSKHNSTNKTIGIILKDNTVAYSKYLNYYNKVNYRYLNAPDSVVIGEISNYFVTDKYQILVDSRFSRAIYLFDNNDEYLNSLSKIGGGPSEYREIASCTIDSKREMLFVYDGYKINIYLLPDFIYKGSIRMDMLLGEIQYFNNAIYGYCISKSKDSGFLVKIDLHSSKNKKELIKEIPEIFNVIHFAGRESFCVFKNNLYFVPPVKNEIFKIDTADKVVREYNLKNNKLFIDCHSFLKKENIGGLREKIKSYYRSSYGFFINDSLLYLSFGIKGKIYSGFSNFSSDKLRMYCSIHTDYFNNYVWGNYVPNNLSTYIEQISPEFLQMIIDRNNSIRMNNKNKSETIESDLIKMPKMLLKKSKNKFIPILVFYK